MDGGGDGGERSGPVPVLTSDRLTLRPLVAGDAEAIRRLVDDWEVARWMGRVPHPYGAGDAVRYLETVAPAETAWAVALPGEGLAGVGGFASRFHPRDMELGYWLGRPFWGRGLATEAARLMLGHAWAAGAASVRSGYFEGNARSGHVLDKLGFAIVGRSTRFCLARGCDLPHVDVALDRPEAG